MLYIHDVCHFIPPTLNTLADSYEYYGLSKAQSKVYTRIYGLEKIPVATNIPMPEMILNPVRKLLNRADVDKEQLQFIIHVHTAKVIYPFGSSISQLIKQSLQLKNTIVFAMTMNNCIATLSAFDVIQKLLSHTQNASAIIVAGEIAYTPSLRLMPNTSIGGDATAAVLLKTTGNKNKLLALKIVTLGKYAKGIWCTHDEIIEFEKLFIPQLVQTIEAALLVCGISKHDIKIILPHNISIPTWEKIAKQLVIPIDKVYLKNIPRYAHCFCADNLINYVTAEHENIFSPGDYYLMVSVGLGAAFAVAVFQY